MRFSAFKLKSLEIQIHEFNSHEKEELLNTTTQQNVYRVERDGGEAYSG